MSGGGGVTSPNLIFRGDGGTVRVAGDENVGVSDYFLRCNTTKPEKFCSWSLRVGDTVSGMCPKMSDAFVGRRRYEINVGGTLGDRRKGFDQGYSTLRNEEGYSHLFLGQVKKMGKKSSAKK